MRRLSDNYPTICMYKRQKFCFSDMTVCKKNQGILEKNEQGLRGVSENFFPEIEWEFFCVKTAPGLAPDANQK